VSTRLRACGLIDVEKPAAAAAAVVTFDVKNVKKIKTGVPSVKNDRWGCRRLRGGEAFFLNCRPPPSEK